MRVAVLIQNWLILLPAERKEELTAFTARLRLLEKVQKR
jgi:hypothetical protein